MPKKNKIKKSYEITKGELTRFNITLYKDDIKNFEELKTRLPYKSLSGMIRFLLDFGVNNIELLKTTNTVDNKNNESVQALINKVLESRPKEIQKEENRFINLEVKLSDLTNKIEKIMTYYEAKDPKGFEKATSKVNGLGGKV